MKKLRISNSSFEKSLNTFVSKRIFGIRENGEKIRSERGLPACYRKVHINDNTELTQMAMWLNNEGIWEATKKLSKVYKAKPFRNKGGFEIKSKDNWVTEGQKMVTVPTPISRFYLTYTFENDCLYFKFLVRYKNGSRNRRIKQMKIFLPKSETPKSETISVKSLISPEDGIRECYELASNKITLDIVKQIEIVLKKIDLSKATEDNIKNIVAIFNGIDNMKGYTDYLVSYIIHILDETNDSNRNQVKSIMKGVDDFVNRNSIKWSVVHD